MTICLRTDSRVADLAQMRLVKIDPREWGDLNQPDVQLRVEITNYGERPILQVLIESAEVESQAAGIFTLSDPTPQQVRIIPTLMQPQLLVTL
jgi:hypothetical protein